MRLHESWYDYDKREVKSRPPVGYIASINYEGKRYSAEILSYNNDFHATIKVFGLTPAELRLDIGEFMGLCDYRRLIPSDAE